MTAEALKPWLKGVIQSADPWLSVDMERGTKWLAEISNSLDERTIGIFCVTPGNANAPWLMFEAGAMSRHLGDEGRVIPYLLDFRSASDLKPPLGQFNASVASEDGTWQLIKTLNVHAENKLDDETLKEQFDLWWPKLAPRLEHIRASGKSTQPARRSDTEKLDELLTIVRGLERNDAPETRDVPSVGPLTHSKQSIAMREIRSRATKLGLDVDNVNYRLASNQLTIVLKSASREVTPNDDAAIMNLVARIFPDVQRIRWLFKSHEEEAGDQR